MGNSYQAMKREIILRVFHPNFQTFLCIFEAQSLCVKSVDGPTRLLPFADGLCYAFIALLLTECLLGIFLCDISGGSVKISLSYG